MNLKEQLSEKIKTRDEARKLILDPYIDQIKIVGITKGLRRLEKVVALYVFFPCFALVSFFKKKV